MSTARENLPEIGELLHDTAADRVGEFRGATAGQWTLRAPGSGGEWEAEPGSVAPAGTYEHVRAEAAKLNARRRRLP
ncbi:hypothetical protein [Streptomyces sp. UNOC14_S4]|uniref:hypothetical protein n=1 Tax=Streptomyces sp. UNOC14_S4 TaxID=2872340 RepID=UPI001E648B03|nr:hypothetical protein [Streptomyces sp. UNOC14_S4]MCC3769740.1 hypothetical protein [Streptomyces sp. UNOC14_S4]